jgi:hypothetical protein
MVYMGATTERQGVLRCAVMVYMGTTTDRQGVLRCAAVSARFDTPEFTEDMSSVRKLSRTASAAKY